MKKILLLLLLFTSCAKTYDVYIGTYSAAVHHALFRDGVFLSDTALYSLPDPSYLCKHGDDLYAVSETLDSTASLSLLPSVVSYTKSEGPCHVSVSRNLAAVSNYAGGTLSIFRLPLSSSGPSQIIPGTASGPDSTRQSAPHVHCAVFSPDEKYLLASDFSADRILVFSVWQDSVSFIDAYPLSPDTGPRHILFNGNLVYVIGELSGNISVLSFNNAQLSLLQEVEADPAHTRASADIRISPDGRHLYASNRLGMDGVAVFDILPDGRLSQKDYTRTAPCPRNISLTPDGKYLLVASQTGGVIEVYSRDPKTGLLSRTENQLRVEKPVCILPY